MPRTCEACGKGFETAKARLRAGRGRYCSKACVGIGTALYGTRRTKPERQVAGALLAEGVTFVEQKALGPFVVDIYLPATRHAIEVDGDYWHDLPAMAERDRKKDAWLKEHGFTVTRVRVGRRDEDNQRIAVELAAHIASLAA